MKADKLNTNLKIINDVSRSTKFFFKSKEMVKEFLDLIASCSSVSLAAVKLGLSPLEVHEVINKDAEMKRLVDLSLAFALEVAEGVLYERAVNGFMEEVYAGGEKVGEKKKFSDSCLMNYLKSNSSKYNGKANSASINSTTSGVSDKGYNIVVPDFE
jgi:hypothetical protein